MRRFEFLMLRNSRTIIKIKSFQMIKTVTKQINKKITLLTESFVCHKVNRLFSVIY